MQKAWAVEAVRCCSEWANGGWDANETAWKNPCTTEWMNQWNTESMNHNESMNQWTNEATKCNEVNDSTNQWTNEWIDEPMNQWVSESRTQWINELMNRCTSELVCRWINEFLNERVSRWTNELNESMNQQRMNQWNNERMKGRMGGLMNGWMAGLLFFAGLLLHWGASSLTTSLSSQLIRAISALSCLRASSNFVASATQFFSSLTCHNAFSSLQLQSRISARVALWSRSTFRATVAMRLAPPSCNPACQEHRSISHASLREAVPMRFVTAGCKPA